MEKFVLVMFLLFTISCKNKENQNKPIDCSRTINSNEDIICFPLFQGMKECYLNEDIQKIVNNRIPKGSLGLGFYLNDKGYNEFNANDKYFFGDYLLFFSTEVLINRKVTYNDFTELASFDQLIKDDWTSIKQKLDKEADDLLFDKPVIIGTYSLDKNHSSTIILTKFKDENQDFYRLTISNCYYIKNKVIFSAYNDEYVDKELVKEIKKKNDFLALIFLQENK